MEIPVKKVILNPEDKSKGLKFISLVKAPAIEVMALTFSKEQEVQVKLAIQSEEKRIIFTPVLIPGQLILRKDASGNPFNIFFDADTIEQIALKWHKDNLSSAVDIEHSRELIPGVTFFESVLLNKDRFPIAKGFELLPNGTLFMTGKVENDEVWNKIKSGEITGVSIDGLFEAETVMSAEVIDEKRMVNNSVATRLIKKLYNA